MRPSFVFFSFAGLCILISAGLCIIASTSMERHDQVISDLGALASGLALTDMAFASDARYTRHPSQADIFSAFQDFPGSIDHFPSGSVTNPPDFSSLGRNLKTEKR